MENNFLLELKNLRSTVLINKAICEYVEFLTDIFIKKYDIMLEVCDYFSISESEMVDILNNCGMADISFLDELCEYTSKILKKKFESKNLNR